MTFLPVLLQIFVGILGGLAIAAAIFWTVFRRYDDIEVKVLGRVAADAHSLYDTLDKMYRRKTMQQVYLMVLVPAAAFGTVGLFIGLRYGLMMGGMVAGVLGFVAYKLPGVIANRMLKIRVEKFDRQLVDALNLMSNAVKSGLSFLQVVQVIEREMPKPISDEFAMVLKENRVGINLNDALLNMTKRVPSDDLFMIVNTVVTLSQQGGNLSEAFETIAKTIRERRRIHERIKTLSQAAVTQGTLLSIIPLVQLGMQFYIQPQSAKLLLTTPLGQVMMAIMFVMMALGGLWMKKILTIDV